MDKITLPRGWCRLNILAWQILRDLAEDVGLDKRKLAKQVNNAFLQKIINRAIERDMVKPLSEFFDYLEEKEWEKLPEELDGWHHEWRKSLEPEVELDPEDTHREEEDNDCFGRSSEFNTYEECDRCDRFIDCGTKVINRRKPIPNVRQKLREAMEKRKKAKQAA